MTAINSIMQNVVSPEAKVNAQKKVIIDIGNYFTSTTTKNLFGCQHNEEVYDCLSRRVDIFDSILSNNLPIWKIINKCDKKVS